MQWRYRKNEIWGLGSFRTLPLMGIMTVGVLLSSCGDIRNDGSLRSRIDSDLILSIDERSGSRYLVVETARIYPCCNFDILYEQKTINSSLISFKRILEYEICQRATGPATAKIHLDNSSDGPIRLTLKVKGKRFECSVDGNDITLDREGAIRVKG